MIYKAKESAATDSESKKKLDERIVEKLLSSIDMEDKQIMKTIRLGRKTNEDINRPLLVFFNTEQDNIEMNRKLIFEKMRFEKQRQLEDETIDRFLHNLEMLRRRSQPDESNRRMNLAVPSKFIDGVKNDELRTRLATQYTPLSTNTPIPEELRLNSN